jgi:hypothetical protein
MEVRSTKNYDLFKYLPENRAIHKSHVKKLEDSITQQNLLSVNPIVLDKNMFILDGQHRLEACKNMDIPVFYTVLSEDCDHTSLFLLQQSKLWTMKEFVDFYVKTGKNKDCEIFQKHYEKYDITYDALANLYSLFSSEKRRRGFFLTKRLIKNGGFNKKNIDLFFLEKTLDEYMNFKDFCESRVIRPKTIYNSTNAVIGFCCFYAFFLPNMKRFFTLLADRWFTLRPGRSYREIVHSLVKIYNYKRNDGILHFDKFETESFKAGFHLGKESSSLELDLE